MYVAGMGTLSIRMRASSVECAYSGRLRTEETTCSGGGNGDNAEGKQWIPIERP
jgi:hypothetical protein